MAKLVDAQRCDLTGMRVVNKDEFDAVVISAPQAWERIEWRRVASIYYTRCEIRDQNGTTQAIHDEDGNYWIRATDGGNV